MKRWTRPLAAAAAVAALAAGLFALGAVTGSAPQVETSPTAVRPQRSDPIAALQETLKRTPGNYRAWAQLGLAYVQQARITADPSFYAKADGAVQKSLTLRPADNPLALTAAATLASARHDFAGALRFAEKALALNAFDSTTFGVKADALVELGRYDEALVAVERMVNLRPGLDAYSRLSYAYELRGDTANARTAMQAAADGGSGSDKAFALHQLGDLAFREGELPQARKHYDAALAATPGYAPALLSRARVLAAQGDPTAGLAEYREAVQAQAQPAWFIELGELLEATGQKAKATEQYDVVRATQKLFADAGVDVDAELAVFEADHGAPATAVAQASRAYRERPKAIFVQDAYAWALHRAGRSREALPVAKAAVRLGTRQPQFWYHLGAIAAAAGDTATARRALTTSLDLNPAFSPLHAPAAKRLLATLQ